MMRLWLCGLRLVWVVVGVLLTSALPASADILWSINLHASDVGYDVEQARVAFQRIRDLGATMVRTDFDWNQLEPRPNDWNPEAIAFFHRYIDEAKLLGLEVVAILSHPPEWALDLYKKGYSHAFMESYFRYSKRVAELYGDHLTYYQYWNEPNNGIVDPIKSGEDWKLFYYADRGVRAGDRNGHRGMVNYITDAWNRMVWKKRLSDSFRRLNRADPQHTVRTIGIDLYPGTWSPEGAIAWQPIRELNRMLGDPSHPCFGFDAVIMETGYSQFFNPPFDRYFGRSDAVQENWYRRAIPRLKQMLMEFNARGGPGRYLLVNLYELYDTPSRNWLDPEARFGIYRDDHSTPKPSAEAIRELLLIRTFVNQPIF